MQKANPTVAFQAILLGGETQPEPSAWGKDTCGVEQHKTLDVNAVSSMPWARLLFLSELQFLLPSGDLKKYPYRMDIRLTITMRWYWGKHRLSLKKCHAC